MIKFTLFVRPKITLIYVCKAFAYCYHSVNVTSFSLYQSDHIKRLPQQCTCKVVFYGVHYSAPFIVIYCPGNSQSLTSIQYMVTGDSCPLSTNICYFLNLFDHLDLYLPLTPILNASIDLFVLLVCRNLEKVENHSSTGLLKLHMVRHFGKNWNRYLTLPK